MCKLWKILHEVCYGGKNTLKNYPLSGRLVLHARWHLCSHHQQLQNVFFLFSKLYVDHGPQQEQTLQDHIECSRMLQYNHK